MADADDNPKTITFGESDEPHTVGDTECAVEWCNGANGAYPYVHEDCGGLIHAVFGDENYDGDYWLYTQCDRCGESE